MLVVALRVEPTGVPEHVPPLATQNASSRVTDKSVTVFQIKLSDVELPVVGFTVIVGEVGALWHPVVAAGAGAVVHVEPHAFVERTKHLYCVPCASPVTVCEVAADAVGDVLDVNVPTLLPVAAAVDGSGHVADSVMGAQNASTFPVLTPVTVGSATGVQDTVIAGAALVLDGVSDAVQGDDGATGGVPHEVTPVFTTEQVETAQLFVAST